MPERTDHGRSCGRTVRSWEPKAVFAKEQPARREVQAEAGASATLSCEVAQAQTEVTWYKDGKKLSASSKVRVEAEGCTRRLVVQQAGQVDAGEYSCEAGGQRLSFRLHVAVCVYLAVPRSSGSECRLRTAAEEGCWTPTVLCGRSRSQSPAVWVFVVCQVGSVRVSVVCQVGSVRVSVVCQVGSVRVSVVCQVGSVRVSIVCQVGSVRVSVVCQVGSLQVSVVCQSINCMLLMGLGKFFPMLMLEASNMHSLLLKPMSSWWLVRPLFVGHRQLVISGLQQPKAVFAKEQLAHRKLQVEAGASATLSCEVAQAQTEVTWYKDGKKLRSSSKVHVEAAGCTRRLVMQQVGQVDAGEYRCEAGGQQLSFHLDIKGQLIGQTFEHLMGAGLGAVFQHRLGWCLVAS
ncbi:hypothetical protein P7K49_035288 [Saguinus oedipus]|uniref:Ig-like domain-containing protein n=1 Tax=Saguinus oedipus TaxID=9490 RepID=A0ABQ9TM75_SAGOE|nr:hypothetical protein P7K49_035288 [Saguinus oedipus]